MESPAGIIAGMDEAGRGSWAGPLVAAAVILPKRLNLPGLQDSKKMLKKDREKLAAILHKKADVGLGLATHAEVDEFGLLHATYRAYARALSGLKQKPDHLLIDGRDLFKFVIPHTSIVRGDQTVRAISAASVVAKVERDRLMLELAKTYPNYGFDDHMGYGTKRHQVSLKAHGPCPIHRLSYLPLKQLKWEQNAFF